MRSAFTASIHGTRARALLIAILMVCSSATDLQCSPKYSAIRRIGRCVEAARLAVRSERNRSVTCFADARGFKRKDEQRECKFDKATVCQVFRDYRTHYSRQENLALLIITPDHLIERPGTPPPSLRS